MAVKLQYLTDPLMGFQTKSGSLNTAGIIRVFDAATDDPVVTYKDFAGTENAQDIRLDDNGRAVVIADDSRAYRIDVCDRYGALMYNQTPMYAKGGGGGIMTNVTITSEDGTVDIDTSSEGGVKNFDLSVKHDAPEYAVCDSYYVMGSGNTGSGYIVPQSMSDGNMTVDSSGILLVGGHHYHIDAWLTVTADSDSGDPSNEYRQREMTLNFRLAADGTPVDMVFDNSFAHSDSFTLSGDLHPDRDTYLKIYFDNYDWADYSTGAIQSSHLSMPRIDVHSIVGSYAGGGSGGGDLPPATPADEGKVLAVDEDGLPEWRSLEEDSSYAIANGSVAFTPGAYYTDGRVTLSDIRSGGIEYAYNYDGWVLEKDHTYVIAFNIIASVGYAESGRVSGRIWLDGFQETDQVWKFSLDTSVPHDESLVGSAIVCPTSSGEVHLNIRYDSNSLTHIPSASVNKAEIVDVTARVSGGGGGTGGLDQVYHDSTLLGNGTQENALKVAPITISMLDPSFRAVVETQSDWTEDDPTSAAYIQNKPQNLVQDPNYVHTDNNFSNTYVTKLDGIESDAEVNKINIVKVDGTALNIDPRDRSVNIPPAVATGQTGATAGAMTANDKQKLDGIQTGAEVNVQSDWNETNSGSDAFILNKPQNLVQDPDYVHTDNNYTDSDKQKLSGVESGAQVNVQSDWLETDVTSDAYILNKPTVLGTKNLVPGTNIMMVQSNDDVIISATNLTSTYDTQPISAGSHIQISPTAQISTDLTESGELVAFYDLTVNYGHPSRSSSTSGETLGSWLGSPAGPIVVRANYDPDGIFTGNNELKRLLIDSNVTFPANCIVSVRVQNHGVMTPVSGKIMALMWLDGNGIPIGEIQTKAIAQMTMFAEFLTGNGLTLTPFKIFNASGASAYISHNGVENNTELDWTMTVTVRKL